MGIFGAIAEAIKGIGHDLNKEYGKTNDFLNGVAASAALIAYADGTLEESEKKTAIEVLTTHPGVSSLYKRNEIETALNSALHAAQTSSGKQTLARQLDEVQSMSESMAQDVYLVAVDVSKSNSNGKAGEDEIRVLGLIAKHLGVDTSKIDEF